MSNDFASQTTSSNREKHDYRKDVFFDDILPVVYAIFVFSLV